MPNTLAELGKQWDDDIVPVLRANSIGKMLMPVNTELSGKGLGVLTVETMKYVARSAAAINYDIQQDIEDSVDITSSPLHIPVQQDDVKIKRRDWEAYLEKGVPIENDLALDMAANIAAQQSTLIADGWKPDGTNYAVKGMYQVANNSVTGSDFDTYGNALATVAAAISELKQDAIYSPGYNLVLSSLNYAELEASYSTAGISEYEQVLKMLNRDAAPGAMPGRVFEGTDLAAGTGMIAPIATQENRRFFDIIETQEPKHHLWFKDGNEESGDIMVRQVGAMIPRFKHLDSSGKDNCVCTITGLDAS
jgi:hypothetical protein